MKRNLKSPTQLAAEGPLSLDQIRWLIFNAKQNGLDSCIARIGRRVYIDTDGFDAWLQAKNPDLRPIGGEGERMIMPIPSQTLLSKEQVELLEWAARCPERRQSVVDMLESMRKLHVRHLEHIDQLDEIEATHERLVEAGDVIATNIEALEEALSELAA